MWLIDRCPSNYFQRVLCSEMYKSLVISGSRDNFRELWRGGRGRGSWVLFASSVKGWGGCVCLGGRCRRVTEAHPSPLSPLLPPSLPPPPAPPGRSQTIVVVTAVRRAAECCRRVGVLRTQSLSLFLSRPLALSLSLCAVQGKRTEETELHISAAGLRSHRDKFTEERSCSSAA